jgi:hypothetical protein
MVYGFFAMVTPIRPSTFGCLRILMVCACVHVSVCGHAGTGQFRHICIRVLLHNICLSEKVLFCVFVNLVTSL